MCLCRSELSAHTPLRSCAQEFGLNSSVGPVNVSALGAAASAGGGELAALLGQEASGSMSLLVEREVKV